MSYAECRYAEYRYAEYHYAEYRYAEYRYAEYRDAFVNYEQKMFYSIGLRNFKMSKKYFRILKVSGLTHKNTRPC